METNVKKVKVDRLKKRFDQMALIGHTDSGGISRLALTVEDQQARELLIQWMQDLGLQTRFDDVGNIYGRLKGLNPDAPAVLTGSHIDSVPEGGKFDGTLGVLAALEAVESMIEQNIEPNHPIEIVAFTNEEGARFTPQMLGSGVVADEFSIEYVYGRNDLQGLNFKNELEKIGFLGATSNRVKNIKAYLEFHIEQGPVLEAENIPVGIVEGIAGFTWMEVTIQGQANHAGTTPMYLRKDSLVTAASVITKLHQLATSDQSGTVITIGRIQTEPNIINAVPGQTCFTIDVRHTDEKTLASVLDKIKNILDDTVQEANLSYTKEVIWSKNPVHFLPKIIHTIENICKTHQIPYKRMMSGAGHDAMYMSTLADTAMIFVPSIAGQSHCKEENTSWHHIEKGVEILYASLYDLAMNETSSNVL